jgi:alkylation response protein AidB-like acyl-CoA dehydrogenase
MDFDLSDDQRKLQDTVWDFARAEVAPRAAQLDRESVFPVDLYQQAGQLGIHSIPFAPEHGGMGLGSFEVVLALEQLARADQSFALSVMTGVGSGVVLSRFGTPTQIERYLPDLVAGRIVASLGGTEPDAGSDTAGFRTRARKVEGGWSITGEKAYISSAGTPISAYVLTMAITSEADADRKKFSLFLVPRDAPGYTVGSAYSKLGWRSSDTRPLYFQDCFVGPDQLVGNLHEGRLVLHKGYQQARCFLAACSLGLAQACLDASVSWAKERQAYGNSLGRLQLIQEMVAQIAVMVDTARLLAYRAAWNVDRGRFNLKELAMAKLYACEAGTKCADLAVQIHGGWGVMDDCAVSRYYRDNRAATIGDGSSQIQTLLIARECGLDVSFS